MKVLKGGTWADSTPKGVMVGGAWKVPQAVHVLKGGVWVKVWPNEAPPPYLYDIKIEYLPNYEVSFTVLDGWPEGDPNEVYMFQCTQIPRNGYVTRTFNKTWVPNGYGGGLDCTLEDLSSIPGKELKKISFKINPRP